MRHAGHATPADAALVEVGRVIADQVDANVAFGTAVEINRALSHLPELVKILRELLATPAARLALEMKPRQDNGVLGQLRETAQGGSTKRRAA